MLRRYQYQRDFRGIMATALSNVCTKANRTLGFLRRNLYSCSQEVKEAAYKGLVRPVLDYGSSVWDPPGVVLQEELESVQKRAARFVTGNYNYETGSMTGILGQLKWNPSRKGGKTIDLYCYIKVLKVKPVYQQMTLSPKLGVVGISTLWHFRLPLPIQMFIKVASSPRLSGIGMPSPILWSHPLKMQRIVLLSSLLWWELRTNSLITGGARWLSGRVSDSGARGPGFETYRRRVVSLSKTLYSPKVLVNYPGSDGSVPIWLKNCWLGR